MLAILPCQEKLPQIMHQPKTALILRPEQGKTPPNNQSNTDPSDKSKDQPPSTGTDASPPAKETAPDNRQAGPSDE